MRIWIASLALALEVVISFQLSSTRYSYKFTTLIRRHGYRMHSKLSDTSSVAPDRREGEEPSFDNNEKYVNELDVLNMEYNKLNNVVKVLRTALVNSNKDSKYVLEALEEMDTTSTVTLSTYGATKTTNGTNLINGERSKRYLNKVTVERCGVFAISTLFSVLSWLALARLWLLGGCLGLFLAYRFMDEDNFIGSICRSVGRRTAQILMYQIVPFFLLKREEVWHELLLVPQRLATLRGFLLAKSTLLKKNTLDPMIQLIDTHITSDTRVWALLVKEKAKAVAFLSLLQTLTRKMQRFLWRLELRYGVLLKAKTLFMVIFMGLSYVTKDSVDGILQAGRLDNAAKGGRGGKVARSGTPLPRALSKEESQRKQKKVNRDKIIQTVADDMVKRVIKAGLLEDNNDLQRTLRAVYAFRKGCSTGVNLPDTVSMLGFYVPGVRVVEVKLDTNDDPGVNLTPAPASGGVTTVTSKVRIAPEWVKKIHQSPTVQFLVGRYVEIRALMLYLVNKTAAVVRKVRDFVSRFISENGEYLHIKGKLLYVECTETVSSMTRVLRRIAMRKSYARKRNVGIVNPWGQPFSSNKRFIDGNH